MRIKRMLEIVVLAAILLLFLLFTDPNNISLPLIIVPYMLGALILYKILLVLLEVFLNGSVKSSKLKLYSLISTAVLINFALLKSIGQITLQDGLISLAIMIVSVIYINKFSFRD